MRFGIFVGPFHSPRVNPSLALNWDLELVAHLDRLGYDEAWFGEHHSGAYEIIPSPEIMIAAAAQRTHRIRLCSGVISLPYHHPLMIADRMVLLDHLTRGRATFGFGPGALVTDSYMMGIDYNQLRPRMEEGLEAILELLAGEGPVNRETDWFTLSDAQLQLAPFTPPRPPISVAQAISPAGPKVAGKFGLGLLSIGTTSQAGVEAAMKTWEIVDEQAQQHGQTVSRDDWTVVVFMHVRETEEQAREDLRYGAQDFFKYKHVVQPPEFRKFEDDLPTDQIIDAINDGGGCVGTPEMAIEFIENLQRVTGGFGSLLFQGTDWARPEATLRHYELFAREVMPAIDGSVTYRENALAWTRERQSIIGERMVAGWQQAKESYEEQRAGAR